MGNRPPKIFIAYAKEDETRATRIYNKLAECGFDPWIDKANLPPGSLWETEISRAIDDSDFFLACLSKISVAKRGYVQKEFKTALDKVAELPSGGIYLLPVRLDDCDIPDIKVGPTRLKDIQWTNISEFEKIVELIRNKVAEDPDEQEIFPAIDIEEQYSIQLFKQKLANVGTEGYSLTDYEYDLFRKYYDKFEVTLAGKQFLIISAIRQNFDYSIWWDEIKTGERWQIIKNVLNDKQIEKKGSPEYLKFYPLFDSKEFGEMSDFMAVLKKYVRLSDSDQIIKMNYITVDQRWELVKYIILNFVTMKKDIAIKMFTGNTFKNRPDYLPIRQRVLNDNENASDLLNIISDISCIYDDRTFDIVTKIFVRITSAKGDEALPANDPLVSKIIDLYGEWGNKKAVPILIAYLKKKSHYEDNDNHFRALYVIAKLMDKRAIEELTIFRENAFFIDRDDWHYDFLDYVDKTIDKLKSS